MDELPGMWEEADFLGGEGEPGPWVLAGFNGPCSRGCVGIFRGETVRLDGTAPGSWECKCCVEYDAGTMASDPADIPEWAKPDRMDEVAQRERDHSYPWYSGGWNSGGSV